MNDNRASSMLVVRLIVCAYLIYLGFSLIHGQMSGAADKSWIFWFFGVLFIAVGLLFGWYTWKKYRSDTTGNHDPVDPEDHKDPENPEQ